MSKPLVSIIIPSYNSKDYLRDAVSSALNQSYESIEVIVIDDGSTDGTRDIFPKFVSKGVNCYYIENGGASNARNFGLEKAKGDYIQFLDADDIIASTKIEKQMALMQKHQSELSYSPWIYFKESATDRYQAQFKFSHINHNLLRSGKELMISYGMENWFIPTVAWLVKIDLIEKAGYWNPTKCPNDDGEYFSRILFWAEQVICCQENLAYYRLTANDSLSKLNSSLKIDASYNSFLQIESLLLTCNDIRLLSYPKRLYYMQYKLTIKKYPELAKRAALNFDRIQAPSFLSKKKYYWIFINWFGLHQGTILYMMLQPFWGLFIRKQATSLNAKR
jgi:glycosyltransferase involved in cell wall biosynthesis